MQMGAYGFVSEGIAAAVATKVVDTITKKKYTQKELKAMNKKEQTIILKSLGVKKIPRLEKDRIKKILELQ